MLVYSSIYFFRRYSFVFLVSILFFFLLILNSCNDDTPVQTGELFDISIVSPQDSATIFQSLIVKLSTNSSEKITKVLFYIDEVGVVSDSLEANLFVLDAAKYADDGFHKIRVVAFNSSAASGYSKPILIKIMKNVRFNISLLSPADNIIDRANNMIELRWLQSSAFSNVIVQISKNYYFGDIIYSSAAQGNHITPPLESGVYSWRLSVDFKDTSLTRFSETRRFEIAGPLPPILISPQNNEIIGGNNAVSFSWQKAIFATRYELLVVDDGSKDTVIHSFINIDSIFTMNLPISAYSWKMRSINSAGIKGEWSTESKFGNDVFYKIVDAGAMLMPIQIEELAGGGFLILGNAIPFEPYSCIIKISNDGSTLWTKRFDGSVFRSFEILADGSILLAGEKTEIMPAYIYNSKITKLDVFGNIVWESLLSSNNKELLFDIKSVGDGYVAVGSKSDSLTNNSLPMILKVSQAGDLVYRKLFDAGKPSKTKLFSDNTNLITLGYASDQNNHIGFGKFDLLANELFEKSFSGWLNIQGAKELTDGNIILGGSVTSNYGMFFKKINKNGDILLESEFNIANPCCIYDVAGKAGSEFFVTGYNNNNGMQNGIYFGRLNANGDVITEKQYPGQSGYSLIETSDGGILILGYVNNGVMCIIKTNKIGTTFYEH